ncbi:DUF342 domain-containing protein [bacterium]|nr:MAG: DUF342 domain-containing protein [bacterium]
MTNTHTTDFKIVSTSLDGWDVQFRIDKAELLDQESLLYHLRGIKRDLAEQFGERDTCMVFDGILNKEETDESVDVVVRIKQCSIEKGDPRIYYKDGIAQDGTRFPKMRALMDIFYLDSSENPIRMSRILRAIREANLDPDLIQLEAVTAKLKEVRELQAAVKEIEIALGRFSDVGKDAEVEFLFKTCIDLENIDAYYSSRRVRVGDVLCHLIPATFGRNKGINVVGEVIQPRKGLDIELEAGSGVVLSSEGTEAIANEDGMVVVTRDMQLLKTPHGSKEFPQKVKLNVNSVLKVEGDQLLDIETNKTVEVLGNLRMGSRILTNCEIHVNGDIENGTLVAGADVVVQGQIRDCTISSDTNVILQGIISNSDLKAKHQLAVKGMVKDSSLAGDQVTADSISNSTVVAKREAVLEKIDADQDDAASKIYVGMSEFYQQRIRENERFLQMASEKLKRIELIVGKDIMAEVTSTNVQNMLLRILVRNQVGRGLKSKQQAAVFRKLLESVPAMRDMMEWKREENDNLQRRLKAEKDGDFNRVVIKERIGSRIVVSINGIETEIPPWDGPVEVSSGGTENLKIVKK